MAVRAFYFSFEDRMAGLFAHLGFYIHVAVKADIRLLNRKALHMDGMAGSTCDVVCLVLANIPVHEFTG